MFERKPQDAGIDAEESSSLESILSSIAPSDEPLPEETDSTAQLPAIPDASSEPTPVEEAPASGTVAGQKPERRTLEAELAEYRTVRRIAAHANTIVYKAEDQTKSRLVIIKVVLAPGSEPPSPSDAAAEGDVADADAGSPVAGCAAADPIDWQKNLDGRQAELDRLLHFRHPLVSTLLDVRTTSEGHLIFVSEFLKGTPILDYARTAKLGLPDRLALFARVCECVAAIHQRCLVHRDLRPTNILVSSRSDVRIVGLGVSILTDLDLGFASNPVSRHEAELFYPYRSPEQIRGELGEIDVRTDVYTLGAVLFELLAGCKPYELQPGPSGEIFRIITECPPADPLTRDRTLAAPVKAILLKALAKSAEQRYDSATDLGVDVQNHLAHRPLASKSSRTTQGSRRWRILLPLAAALVCAAMTFGKPWLAKSFGEPVERPADRSAMLAAQAAVAELKARLGQAEQQLEEHRTAAAAARDKQDERQDARAREISRLEARIRKEEALREKADLRAERAEKDAARAASVSEFLMGAFEALPDAAGGKSGRTVADVLSRAAAKAGARFAKEPDTEATICAFLANAWKGMGQLDEATSLQERAFKLRQQALGTTHEQTVVTQDELANLLFAQARFAECAEVSRKLVVASRKAFGDEDPRTLTTLNNLGRTLHALGDLDGAESLFREALEGRRRVLGDEDLKTAMSAHDLAAILFQRGNMAEAEALLRDSLRTFQKSLPKEHPLISTTQAYLGASLIALGRYDKAEPLLLEAHAKLRDALGEDHPFARTVRDRLFAMYTLWNKPEKAAEWKPSGQAKPLTSASSSDEHR